MKTTPPASPALELVRLVSDNAQEVGGHSWTRLNGDICDAVTLAIRAGLRFDEGDFKAFTMIRHGRWILADAAERWYALAVEFDNRSACRSLELWRDRPIFQHPCGSGRLAVGATFAWQGERVEVTSFDDAKGTLTAVAHVRDEHGHPVRPARIARRFTISPADLLAARKAEKARTQPCPKCKAEVPAKKVGRACPVPECGGWIHAERSR